MDEKVIIVNSVSKDFRLPHQRAGSIKHAFTNVLSFSKKTFETQHALKNISFEINKGEFFGIVGRNGSGKSTLLKILAGIYQPSSGSVSIGGRVVPFIELGVGFNGELTGRENVYLNGALLGFSEKEIDVKYQDIVDFAELERFMDQKLKNYSSGMQVRLAFSVATRLAQSDILLIDEVLAVGDADFQRKCFDYFRDLKKQRKTVIFVSHDMNAVREYCDRAVLIDNSKMVTIGSAGKVATAYTRMFTDELKSKDQKDTSSRRWGDGSMKHHKVEVSPKTMTEEDKELEIIAEIKINEDIEDPIFGFSITNAYGTTLLGTNTKLQRIETGNLKKGDTVKVSWRVNNIFGDGTYFVGVAAVHRDGVRTGEWWDEAKTFTVVKEIKSPYVINPDIIAEFTEES